MPSEFTEDQVRNFIRQRCEKPSSQAAVADELNISKSYLNKIVLGRETISPAIALKFGFVELERSFIRTEEEENG